MRANTSNINMCRPGAYETRRIRAPSRPAIAAPTMPCASRITDAPPAPLDAARRRQLPLPPSPAGLTAAPASEDRLSHGHTAWASAPISPHSARATAWSRWTNASSTTSPRTMPALHVRLLAARAAPDALDAAGRKPAHRGARARCWKASSPSCSALARRWTRWSARTRQLDPVHACKRLFVQRQAVKKYPDPSGFDGAALRAALEAEMTRAAHRGRASPPMSIRGSATSARRSSTSPCAMPPGPR